MTVELVYDDGWVPPPVGDTMPASSWDEALDRLLKQQATLDAEIEAAGGSSQTLERTDEWVTAKPRSRRLPLNREMKRARVGKVGGPSRKEALAAQGAQGA